MPKDANNCPLCDRSPADGVRMGNSGQFDGLFIECPLCGRYELVGTGAIAASWNWPEDLRRALSCATRQAFEAGQKIRLTAHNTNDIAAPHMRTRVADNEERFLQKIANSADRPHKSASFSF